MREEGEPGLWMRRFVVRCPWHAPPERTPSVICEDTRPDDVRCKGRWQCLGCGRSGYWYCGDWDAGKAEIILGLVTEPTP